MATDKGLFTRHNLNYFNMSNWYKNAPAGAFKDPRDPEYEEYDFDEAFDAECDQADRDYEDREIERFERERDE